jgi:site-specific DNA-methyltransferase (adenine-specific)
MEMEQSKVGGEKAMTVRVVNRSSITYPYMVGFDHVITDPPYSPKVHKKASTMRGGKAGKNDFGFSHLTPLLRASIAQRVALADSWSVIFSDWEGISAWKRDIEQSGAEWVRVIPWVRWSMPQLSGDRPTQGSEAIIVAHSGGKKSWNGPGNLVSYEQKCMRGKDKHPTQKPLDLMMLLVEHFSEPGATIIDPCAGAGTTLLAAKLLGRHGVGLETDSHWADVASRRLTDDLCQRDLDHVYSFDLKREQELDDIERTRAHTAKIRRKREREKNEQEEK